MSLFWIASFVIPPNSNETFFKFESAAAFAIIRPTSVDPEFIT